MEKLAGVRFVMQGWVCVSLAYGTLYQVYNYAFNTICAVFAKSEAITYLRKGVAKSDILAGLHDAIANRSLNLLRRVSIEKDFSITGGIAKNSGMVAKLREKAGLAPLLCEDPQLIRTE